MYDPVTKTTTVAGVQRFDGLGRVVSTTCGAYETRGRTTTFRYERNPAARPNTDVITGPDEMTCTVTRDPRLGGAVLGVEHRDSGAATVSQAFRYNTLTGHIKEATEGGTRTRMTYRPPGRCGTGRSRCTAAAC